MATPTVVFDVESLTLGEAWEIEKASGEKFGELIKKSSGLKLIALFVSALRNGEPAPSWQKLLSLRIVERSSSASPSPSDGTSEASKASPTPTQPTLSA